MNEMRSDQEIQRRESLKAIREMGINPYPHESFSVNATTLELQNYSEGEKEASIAGRLMNIRGKGSTMFAELQDQEGRIQIYLRRDELCPGEDKDFYNKFLKKHLDLGDLIGVKGEMFITRTGEPTIRVKELKLLAKTLRPLPVVKTDAEGNRHHAFSDPDLRYRRRYLDLTVNPHIREVFQKRAALISAMRRFFDERNWLEVETPVLQPVHGGAAAKPFTTHHQALDMPLYLRIANELYLKRLIVGGFEGVYEFGKMFRNEGMSRLHNPEFTVLEIYIAYKDYEWMMKMVEELLEKSISEANQGIVTVTYNSKKINFSGPYERLRFFDAIQKYGGVDVRGMEEEDLRKLAVQKKIHLEPEHGKAKILDLMFEEWVESELVQPTYIIDHPVEMTPLAKRHRKEKDLVERFELFVAGSEIANAYTELNDPDDQRKRFEEQLQLANRGDEEAMGMDEDFIRSLEYGMPPTSGLGIGIDRLTMLLTGMTSIQEVLFFPQMRPESS